MEQPAARKQGYWGELAPKQAVAMFAAFCCFLVVTRAAYGALSSSGLQPLVRQPGCPKAEAALLASAIDQTSGGFNGAMPQRHAASLACHVRSLLYKQHAGMAVSAGEAAALHRLRNMAGVPPRASDIEWLEQLLAAVEQAASSYLPSQAHTPLLWLLVCFPIWVLAWAARYVLRLADLALCAVTLATVAYHWQLAAGSDDGPRSLHRSGSSRRRSDEPPWPAERPPPETCQICFEADKDFILEGCNCAACFECLRRHAVTKLREGGELCCPHCMVPAAGGGAAANVLISRNQLEVLLDPRDLLIYERRQMALLLPGMRPCPHCADMVEVDDDVDLRLATCPNVTCGRPLHIEDEAADRHFRSYTQQQGLKECPRCGFVVEKVQGCNHMRCRCGAHFCYSCGVDIGHFDNAYDHFGPGSCRMYEDESD